MAAQAVWGSSSCSRTLPNADQGNRTSDLPITGRWLSPWATATKLTGWQMLASYLLHGHEGGFNHGLISAKQVVYFQKCQTTFSRTHFGFFGLIHLQILQTPPKRSTVLTLSKTWESSIVRLFFFVFFSLILIFFKSQYFQNPTSGSDAKYTSNLRIYMCLYQSLHFLYLLGVKLFLLTDFAPGGICWEPFQ